MPPETAAMPIDNPYAPPAIDLGPTGPAAPDYRRQVLWSVGFLANMVVPCLFATLMLSPLGWIGLVAASLTLLALGLMILKARPGWIWPATTGAFLVATTQLRPLLQVFVGTVAVGISTLATGTHSWIQSADDRELNSSTDLGPGAAFLATILGGLALMGFSLIVGLAVEAIWGQRPGRSQSVNVEEIRWCE